MIFLSVLIQKFKKGLHAAHLLKKLNATVQILEAADYLGGRIKQDSTFLPGRKIEIGGEVLHGGNKQTNIIMKMAEENGWKFVKTFDFDNPQGKEACFFGLIFFFCCFVFLLRRLTLFFGVVSEGQFVGFNTEDKDFKKLFELMEAYQTERDPSNPLNRPEDMSVAAWLYEQGMSSRLHNIADCIIAKTFGANLHNMGIKELALQESSWDYGHDNYKFEGSFGVITDFLKKNLKPDEEFKLNWKVTRVEYDDEKKNKARVFGGPDGKQVIEADYVIVTVPLTILKDGDIKFSPELPLGKRTAIQKIKMDAGMKLFLKFNKKFWPSTLDLVFADHPLISQFWMVNENGKDFVIVGFTTAEKARLCSKLPEKEVIASFLKLLDTAFGKPGDTTPATNSFKAFIIKDWTKDPNIRGAYSYPTPHTAGLRAMLAEPVANRLFFAGEATNTKTTSTVQAALESGQRVVAEIATRYASLLQVPSKL